MNPWLPSASRLQKRRLLIVATLLTSITALADGLPPAPQPPEAIKSLSLEVLKSLVETNSTHDHGTTLLAQAIGNRLHAAGFAAEDVQVLTPVKYPGKGNVVVRIHGHGAQKPLLFIGHLDVVEAKKEDWSVDPFVLTAKDGYFYGRDERISIEGFYENVEFNYRLIKAFSISE